MTKLIMRQRPLAPSTQLLTAAESFSATTRISAGLRRLLSRPAFPPPEKRRLFSGTAAPAKPPLRCLKPLERKPCLKQAFLAKREQFHMTKPAPNIPMPKFLLTPPPAECSRTLREWPPTLWISRRRRLSLTLYITRLKPTLFSGRKRLAFPAAAGFICL